MDHLRKPILDLNLKKPYDFWDYINNPKYVCAPMVDQSELSFRLLTRRHGVDLAYTPMIHSVIFLNNEKYKKKWKEDINNALDFPTFVQFCGHDPEILLKAAKEVEGKCEGIDLNLGCPQGIAKRGCYGSYLLDNTDLVLKILGYLSNNIRHSAVTCKIRLFPDIEKTYELVKSIEKVGVKVLAVHGRTKEEKGNNVKYSNWDAIRMIKSIVNIPVISNGGIERYEDVEECFKYTNCDAVMSSEGLLENPSLFKGREVCDIDDISLEYLDISKEYNNDLEFVRSHLFKFMYRGLKDHPDLNQKLGVCKTYDDFYSFVKLMKELRSNKDNKMKLGYYRRYRLYDREGNIISKEQIDKKDKGNNDNNEILEDEYIGILGL